MYVEGSNSDKEMTGDQAIKKILPHFDKKFSKALALISKLFGEALTSVSSEMILLTCLLVHENFDKLIDLSDVKVVLDIFQKVEEKERDIFDEESQRVFDLFCFGDRDRALIMKTDDSFEVGDVEKVR